MDSVHFAALTNKPGRYVVFGPKEPKMIDKKILFSIIFILIVGISGMFITVHSGITGKGLHGQTLIISGSNNLFIRYSLQLMFFFGSLGCLLLPILFFKRILRTG